METDYFIMTRPRMKFFLYHVNEYRYSVSENWDKVVPK